MELKNKTVLLVDDDERNTYALSNFLEQEELHVLEARNGEEAMHFLRDRPEIDIVLLDMMMPVMDGFETLQAMQLENERIRSMPVIAVTAKAMKGDREKCLEAGAWEYISKPIQLSLLLEQMKQCLDRI
jgi:two-component system chemotaxis sensor kinase CheA